MAIFGPPLFEAGTYRYLERRSSINAGRKEIRSFAISRPGILHNFPASVITIGVENDRVPSVVMGRKFLLLYFR